jgi:hypothetical protein
MKTQAQLIESVQRFQESFWDRNSTDRPPVGIYDEDLGENSPNSASLRGL